MARKLKVFAWSDGFHRYLVATTSRARALEAWGFDRNLFREGAAGEIEADAPGAAAALAAPGEVVELDVSAGVVRASPRKATAAARPAEEARRRRARARVRDLEAALADSDAAAAREAEDDAGRLAALRAGIAERARRRDEARERLAASLARAREAADR